jgi:phosphoribosylpyrophosphate synthetase
MRENTFGTCAVNVFVTHAQFTNDAWKSFLDFKDIDLFITTNTIPRVSDVLAQYPAKFKVLDVRPMMNKYLIV